MMHSRSVAQPSQKCPICGSSVTTGVMVCPNCGEEMTKASMIVSTSVRPLSRDLRRKVGSGSKALPIILAVIVVATAVVGLGYVPPVSARVPQLASFSSAVEDAVGRAVQWGREMMGQPPGTKPRAPAKKKPAPAPAPQKPVAQQPAPKPAPTNPTQSVKRPAKPAAKPLPAPPAQKAMPTAASSVTPLEIGARAPQFVLKDLRGVLYRLPDYQGRRVALLLVSTLDEDGRAAIRQFISRFGNRPEDEAIAVVIVTQAQRVDVRKLVAAGIRVPILFGNARIASAYRVPKDGGVLYVITERGVIAQARVFR